MNKRRMATILFATVAISIIFLIPREYAIFFLLPLIFTLSGLVIGLRAKRPIVFATVGLLIFWMLLGSQ